MTDKNTTIQDLKNKVLKFSEERDWTKYHKPRNLAISIAVEAAELLEHFQWQNLPNKNKEIEKELADIIIYCLEFAISSKIDIASAIEKKVEYNSNKYPRSLFNQKNKSLKDYERIKKEFRSKEKKFTPS